MPALYRSGRQAEALGVYQDARRALVDELGLEPGPALQQLHAAILRQERSLDAPRRVAAADATAQDVVDGAARGRLVPVLGAETGELAAQARRAFDTPPTKATTLARAAQYVALMRGAGPLYDELHELVGVDARPTRSIASSRRCRRCCERGARRTS